MFDNKGRFIIKDYTVKSTFSSFLPGISGKFGIPIWCFYVNRGQGVTSFGVEDKEHSIMEFYPAHQAYQLTKTLGFRTFLRVDGTYYEPFQNDLVAKNMYIGMNELEVEEIHEEHKIKTNVLYFTLPGENLGGLIRKVTLKNMGDAAKNIELLDGMPAILPFGVDITSVKTMGQTVKAWMQVEDISSGLPFFRVRVGMEDTADVHEVLGGHFYFTVGEDGKRLPVIVDPEVIFEYDTAMSASTGLRIEGLDALLSKKQVDKNNLPCAFFGKKVTLEPGEEITIYGIVGQAANKGLLQEFSEKCSWTFFQEKQKEAFDLTSDLCEVIGTKTASAVFDAYCKQTYLDNLLRGGCPKVLGKDKIFYLYSRKHGDIERDYNFFRMLPEFYSQGNANFRDVNQNRRCDVLFYPFVKKYNIKTFYNLIQTDGYNPLAVEKTTYYIEEKDREKLLGLLHVKNKEKVLAILTNSFTPGNIANLIYENEVNLKESSDESFNQNLYNITLEESTNEVLDDNIAVTSELTGPLYNTKNEMERTLNLIMDFAKENVNAEFGEGYWSDHWTYNLDLIESYLMIYPDKEKELLFEDSGYTYFESKAVIKPRKARYVETNHGIRQYKAIDIETKKEVTHKLVKANYGKGEVFTSTLMAKLLLMDVLKVAALDPYGMGIEMEGGKPGWYDALNGLPGIFGSSVCETYELYRMLLFTRDKLVKYETEIELPEELANLLEKISQAILLSGCGKNGKEAVFTCWNQMNDAKEMYRNQTAFGFEGDRRKFKGRDLIIHMDAFITYVNEGITRALDYGKGISPAYFAFEATDYERKEDGIYVKTFKVIPMPYFLEGPVRYLKVLADDKVKKELYDRVKTSNLYDSKLRMYKVNESLEKASFEIGRAKAFTPGWLENESIWLHMEYKYLLELLKSGLTKEFFADFKTQCIPFLDPKEYGRSILENSSFIASSANPNEKIHGKGFVARLSGSTAEFLHMWQLMMFGTNPFQVNDKGLELKLSPILPDYLLDENNEVQAVFLGNIKTTYHFNKKADVIPGEYKITRMELNQTDNKILVISDGSITGENALSVRNGLIKEMRIEVEI